MAKKKASKSATQPVVTTAMGGNVHLTITKGKRIVSSKTIHNVGTMRLFRGLLIACRGEISEGNYPKYLSVGDGRLLPGENPAQFDGLISEYNISRPELESFATIVDDPVNNSVRGTFRGIISSLTVAGVIYEIGLFGTPNTNTLLARVELSADEAITLRPGENLVVEWDIALQNKA